MSKVYHFSIQNKYAKFCFLFVNGWCMLRSGFRSAFLSEGHGTAMRESAVGEPPNPALHYVLLLATGV